tara:strand:+ start:349 stop:2205 length:1857 start_codon:yes stop_codon:yes gene_type:complete
MGLFNFFKNKEFDIDKDPVNYWIKFIKDEIDANGKIKSPYLNLIQHKTDFYKNDSLVFSGWELIIEVYEDDSDDAEQICSIWPELVCGDSRILKGSLDKTDYTTYIIENTPKFDNSELGNGLSNIISGDIEEIAIAIVDTKKFDYKNLLPLDKLDFAYFDYFSNESQISIVSYFKLVDEIFQIKADIIGAEVYAYSDIINIDKKIKSSIKYDDIVLLRSYQKESYYEEILSLQKDDKKELEKISKKNKLDLSIVSWIFKNKNLDFPDKEVFTNKFLEDIEKLNNLLNLFKKHNPPSYQIIYSELTKFKICIWDVYSEVIDFKTEDNIIEEITSFKYPRCEIKKIGSDSDYEKHIEKEPEEEFPLYIKEKEILKNEFKEFSKEYKLIIENSQNLEVKKINDSNLSELHLNKGASFYENGDIENAIKEFNESLKLNPSNDVSLYNRSLCYFDLNKFSHALADLSKAIEINDKQANYFYMRGLVLSSADQNKSAIDSYSKCIEIDNDYLSAYLNRALLLQDIDDNDGALSDFDNVIRIDEHDFRPYLGKAFLLLGIDDDNSLLNFLKVIEVNPEYSAAYKECYKIYHWYGHDEKAEYHAKKYLELVPDDNEFNNLLEKRKK